MIVHCTNCDTNFNLPDARIPAEGAKVRCSRCQHGFHVASLDQETDSLPTLEDTEMELGEETLDLGEDSDLENPEFLYAGGEEKPEEGESPFADGLDQDLELEAFGEDASELGAAEGSTLEEPAPMALSEPEPEQPSGAEEDPMGEWNPLEDDPKLVASASEPIPVMGGGARPAGERVKTAGSKVGDVMPEVVREPRAKGRFSALLGTIVGVFLIAGGLRVLKLHAIDPVPGPSKLQSTGWIATDIGAVHVHDAQGRRVLVVRGRLSSDGSTPTPAVRAALLDAAGAPLGPATQGVMIRLEGVALAPEALERRLDSPSNTRPQGPASGFTVLIPEPPEEARRYQVKLVR